MSIVDSKDYLITGSVGQGNWATVPWVCIFDRAITTSATKGVWPMSVPMSPPLACPWCSPWLLAMVVFENGKINAYADKKIIASYSVDDFSRRPGAVFRKLQSQVMIQ